MSMSPEIMKRYLRLSTAHEIWTALSKAFYDGSDELQLFALNQKAFAAKQNRRSLSEYYGELTVIFQELDHRDKVVMKDPDDVVVYKKSIERLRVHIFLVGLDDHFEQVRGEILRQESTSGLEESYALIRREENRRVTLKGDYGDSDAAAMVIRNKSKTSIGYPDWWDQNRGSQRRKAKNFLISAVAETKTSEDNVESTSTLVATTRKVKKLRPSLQKSVLIANGNEVPIIGEGSITATNSLNLDSVLIVPSLNYSLLSVSQITSAFSCIVIFWPNFCCFKDIQMKQTIGCGIRRGNLYYLDMQSNTSSKLHHAFAMDGPKKEKNEAEIWLQHRRLGHASFGYLKKLFPGLFNNIDVSTFRCDVCELAKSHRSSFSLSFNRGNLPFMIVHSDVWGPSKISTLGGSR
ncbi:uncharacterized protein LOC125369450 [Ricinus communis]|uniref:uncharacterized protein LOC125369450 n=1 Tax=Ricinus communis TaxID=3988 RepID=UPI00201A5A24|nr:uncharacterized protein LOC125369450 [Ricinus communis]